MINPAFIDDGYLKSYWKCPYDSDFVDSFFKHKYFPTFSAHRHWFWGQIWLVSHACCLACLFNSSCWLYIMPHAFHLLNLSHSARRLNLAESCQCSNNNYMASLKYFLTCINTLWLLLVWSTQQQANLNPNCVIVQSNKYNSLRVVFWLIT